MGGICEGWTGSGMMGPRQSVFKTACTRRRCAAGAG